MQFILKYFPEVTIKSKPVRKEMSRQLQSNLRKLLRGLDDAIVVTAGWDTLAIDCPSDDEDLCRRVISLLGDTPGIAHFLEVVEHPLGDMDAVARQVGELWQARLVGKSFVVRCKRAGEHDFRSNDVERYVGGALLHGGETGGVDLHHPDVTVALEIRHDRLYIVKQRHEGLGGFPLGSVDPVLSLVSGGFDSTVASYLTMRRGMQTHFLFFNLGGQAHERGVVEISQYLWLKYGASHPVKFVAVPFEGVVAEILERVHDSYMGVVLKRMMLRAGQMVAAKLGIEALVTGESVAQVSSQTLANLAVIDAVSDMLVLRPLATTDKTEIVHLSRAIGAEELAASIPEYCGVISVKPKTRARRERVEAEEQQFDFSLLEQAVEQAEIAAIDAIDLAQATVAECEVLAVPIADSVILDIRHPAEEESSPLRLSSNRVLKLPFYQLHSRLAELDRGAHYMLYCDRGVMSRIHAAQLVEEGFSQVSVYRPR